MDLRLYYQKIRDAEAKIKDEFPLVVSQETADGGKAGTLTEVPRHIAAKLLVEGLAQLASPAQRQAFVNAMTEAKRVADEFAAAAQVHVTVLSSSELEKLKNPKAPAVS